jgi:hypothetical protein
MRADFVLSTPVVLVVFNRPQLTRRIFDAVRNARPPKLLIVADGPRANRPEEAVLCANVRTICQDVDWPCEVITNFAPTNMGCRNRVASGLTWAFEHVEEAIILEDDCLPHESFFRFCQELLDRHRNDTNVAMISGNCFLPGGYNRTFASYFFTRYAHIWGWATWRRAIQHYDVTMKRWPEVNAEGWLEDFFQNDPALVAFWRSIFTQVYNGQIDTWDYQLTLSFWLRGMISICPARNLISNIGFGPDATHTKDANSRSDMPAHTMQFPLVAPSTFTADSLADEFAAWSVYNVPAFKGSLRMQMLFNQIPPSLYGLSEQQRNEYRGNILSLATLALQGGDAATAFELTELCARTGCRMQGLFYIRGLCSLALGDRQGAKTSFESELSYYPDNTQAREMYSTL